MGKGASVGGYGSEQGDGVPAAHDVTCGRSVRFNHSILYIVAARVLALCVVVSVWCVQADGVRLLARVRASSHAKSLYKKSPETTLCKYKRITQAATECVWGALGLGAHRC